LELRFMNQSTSSGQATDLHVAIIMDGNGRWATARGRPRIAGHRAGGDTVRRVVEAAPDLGIGTLTLYAFSSDNWSRPRREVAALMDLLGEYLRREVARCLKEGVRISFIGRRDRIPSRLVRAMETAETETEAGRTLHLRLALDYSARDAILRAARHVPSGEIMSRESFGNLLAEIESPGAVAPEVDLLIRTGGERRLSDFLLWESAYAELHFTSVMWPDFATRDLERAVDEFNHRERRFGGLPKSAAG
jgi:undecaprenyl diphosphate synthase